MSQESERDRMVKKTVVHEVPGMESVTVRRDIDYKETDAGALTFDLYAPPTSTGAARAPAVVFVSGYPDPGFEAMLGCRFKDLGQYTSWGRLAAASGLAAVTYTNRAPAADLPALLQHLRQNAASLGIDERRIGLWACSGNVPMALSALMREASGALACAVLCYGFMLDLGASTRVAEAAAQFGFVNPCAGKTVDDLPPEVPLFIARAGQDRMPHLNESIDRFVAGALARNLPVTLANHAAAPHAFDVFDDSKASRETIRSILGFLRSHLAP
ncbi:alpha/beta hydrolase [Sorangium sp. So ce134]